MVDEDEDRVLNTYSGAPYQGTGVGGAPGNYLQMKSLMRQIVADFKAQGISCPSNEMVLKEYSRRMLAFRNQH